jgi:hypothetical protein
MPTSRIPGLGLVLAFAMTMTPALTAADLPLHMALAEDIFSQLLPENNVYGAKPTAVRLKTGGDPAINHSVCSTFLVALLTSAGHYNDQTLEHWFNRPDSDQITAADIYTAFSHGRGVTIDASIKEVKVGDIIAISYLLPDAVASAVESDHPDGRTGTAHAPTGHVMLVDALPVKLNNHDSPSGFSGHAYAVSVLDCSAFPHGQGDTRTRPDAAKTGLGKGTIRLLTGESDQVVGYTWTTLHTSIIYMAENQPLVVARLNNDSHP